MLTPFPLPLPSGIVVDIAKPTDLRPLAAEVRTSGRRDVQGKLSAWLLLSLKLRGRTEIIGLGMLPDGEVVTTGAVEAVDGDKAIRTMDGETYELDWKADDLHPGVLEQFWKALRTRGLVEART